MGITFTMCSWLLGAALCAPGDTEIWVGDDAPPLAGVEWLAGDPVDEWERRRVHVVAFWSTGCTACTGRGESLQAAAERHADDVTVVRLAAFTRGGEPTVEEWLAEQESPPAYRVARDRREAMERAWLDATDRRDRHVTYIVDDRGRLAWLGEDIAEFDETLDAVIAGKFDSRRFGKELAARDAAAKLADPLYWKLSNSVGREDWSLVVEISEELMDLGPDYQRHAVDKYHALLRLGNAAKASSWARTMLRRHIWDDADALGRLAWMLSEEDSGLDDEQRDLELAVQSAERADELTGHGRPWVIQALAQAHFARGDALRASELQVDAVSLEQDERLKEDALRRLKRFRAAAGLPEEPPPPPPAPPPAPDGAEGTGEGG